MDFNYVRTNTETLKGMANGLHETEKMIEKRLEELKKSEHFKHSRLYNSAEGIQFMALHCSLRGYIDAISSMVQLLDLSSAIVEKTFDFKEKPISSDDIISKETFSSFGLYIK